MAKRNNNLRVFEVRTDVYKANKHGRFPYIGTVSTGFGHKKLDVASVLEEQLKMLGIEAKLVEPSANLARSRVVGGRPGPALISAFVLKLEETSVCKKHRRFVELGIRDVADGNPAREISQCGHKDHYTAPPPE